MKWLFWPVSVAVVSRTGRCLLPDAAALARVGGRYEPYWRLFAVWKWLPWPVSVAVMSRGGRYLPHGVAVLARIAGRYEPYWPLVAVWRGCSGPYRWPL